MVMKGIVRSGFRSWSCEHGFDKNKNNGCKKKYDMQCHEMQDIDQRSRRRLEVHFVLGGVQVPFRRKVRRNLTDCTDINTSRCNTPSHLVDTETMLGAGAALECVQDLQERGGSSIRME